MEKITDNSNELNFHQLTSGSDVLVIPLFQRAYVWTNKQLARMIAEIESIESGKDINRFLGAIIAVSRTTNPSQPSPLEIVDGQQRLTTLYLFLLASAQVAARKGNTNYARGLISTNLIVDWAETENTKLQPSISDRGQFAAIFSKVSQTGELENWLPVKLKLPNSSGEPTGPLLNQFNRISKYLLNRVNEEGIESLEALVEIIRNGLSFVFILLKDPGSATTVFEGLNDPGVPISVGDLVKNEVFARIGYDEEKAKLLHDNQWKPFSDKFGKKFDDYFFPFSIIHKPGTTRTDMFGELRLLWDGLESEDIIDSLDEFSEPYLTLTGLVNPTELYGSEIGSQLHRMIELKQPSSTFPFVMKLLKQFSEKKVSKKDVIGCMQVLESFLVRRAICGIEPTGLLVMFRTMWSACGQHPTADRVVSVIGKRTTVEWPSDDRLLESILTRPIYGSGIAKYIVVEYDRAQGMDHPTMENFTLEHIMPRTYSDNWSTVVSKAEHKEIKDLWANLIPLSDKMNTYVDQDSYENKKVFFAEESMFVSTRKLGKTYETWNKEQILSRSHKLATWAISRWKR